MSYPKYSTESLSAAALSLRISVYQHLRDARQAEAKGNSVKAQVERNAADVLEHLAKQIQVEVDNRSGE